MLARQTNGSYTWKVRTIDADNKEPFVIRAVESNDFSPGKLKTGDFFSAMFYIARAPSDTFSVEPSSTPSALSVSSSGTPTDGALSASAAKKQKKKKRNLGLGLGIGLGVALLLVMGGALLMLRRRKRRRAAIEAQAKEPVGTCGFNEVNEMRYSAPVSHEIYTQPAEAEGSGHCAELPGRDSAHAVELPTDGSRNRT